MKAEQILEKALLAVKARDYPRAEWLLTEAIKRRPDDTEAWLWRGHVLVAQERWFDALLHYDRALALNEASHVAWTDRGICAAHIGLWEMAEECFRKSLNLVETLEPHVQLGGMFVHLNRLREAEQSFRDALALKPDNHDAKVNLGLSLLGQGRWDEAWPHYYGRHFGGPYTVRARRSFPEWQGENLCGKTILLYREAGYGDEIMSLRFADDVKRAAGPARIIVEARPALVRVARSVASVNMVVAEHDHYPDGIDCSCALMDVPMRLGITPKTLSNKPYITAPARDWGYDLPQGLNVGLCWLPGLRPLQPETKAVAAHKSIPLEWLKPLRMPGVNLISLQREHGDPVAMREMNIIDGVMDEVDDFADTAAMMSRLDLVITVDTAVAHLAGALGKPVWNLVRYSGTWPWMHEGLGGTDLSCWYASMMIYRQPRLEDWEAVINRVAHDLKALVT